MKAVIYERFGSPEVLKVADVDAPVPRRGEVLVRVEAAALNPKDALVRKGKLRWAGAWRLPRTPGYDFAGRVERADDAVAAPGARLAVGDEVFGMVQAMAGGCCAELVALPADQLAPRPAGLSAEQAAALPLVSLTALQALRDLAQLRGGQRVLINGASGGVGTVTIQIARALGAHVTAVCSAANADLVRDLGADDVIDYHERAPTSGGPYDVFFDVFGNCSYASARVCLSARGRYVTTVPSARNLRDHVLGRVGLTRARLVVVRSRRADLELVARLVERDELRPVIDRVFPLAEVRDAHAHLETRRARGKIVLRVSSP